MEGQLQVTRTYADVKLHRLHPVTLLHCLLIQLAKQGRGASTTLGATFNKQTFTLSQQIKSVKESTSLFTCYLR